MKQLLLVEDDPEIIQLLDLHLNAPLYQLQTCQHGREAMAIMEQSPAHLLILDVMLPDMNGLELCKQIRRKDATRPILMLTSLSEESDKVLALELGADDYLTKPFGILELRARIKALLRRSEQQPAEQPATVQEICIKELAIDPVKKKAAIGTVRLDLTPKEFELLLLLASNPGRSFSRLQLLEQVWGYAFTGYAHTITAHINRLRIKIEPDLDHPQYILTSWGIGYRFTE